MHKHPTHSLLLFITSLPFPLVKTAPSPRERIEERKKVRWGSRYGYPLFILLFHKVICSKRAGDTPCQSHPNSPFFSLLVFVYPARGTKNPIYIIKFNSFFSFSFFHFFPFFFHFFYFLYFFIFSIFSFSFSFFLPYSLFFLLFQINKE